MRRMIPNVPDFDGSNWRLWTPGWYREWFIVDHEWELDTIIQEYSDFLNQAISR